MRAVKAVASLAVGDDQKIVLLIKVATYDYLIGGVP